MANVLVVEDHPANLKLARLILEHAGNTVWSSDNAVDGIRLAAESQPDVIFMDIQLPGMDGFEAIRRLRGDARTRDIPIIALTAYAMPADERRMIDAGCDGYLPKPYRREQLLGVLAEVLEQRPA